VQGRPKVIPEQNKEELHKYMTGIVRERDQKLLAVHCRPDHTHLLIGLRPSIALCDLAREVKNGSTHFINRSGWVMGRFCWQEGFGAFSYGHSQLKGIMDYIRDPERHHARSSFRDEYLRFLKRFELEHDEKYIFKPLDGRQVRSPLRGLAGVEWPGYYKQVTPTGFETPVAYGFN
jgi:REP-associated tyrosine transposase